LNPVFILITLLLLVWVLRILFEEKRKTITKYMLTQIRQIDIISISDSLNDLLANYHIHYQKLRNFHWTVYGKNFFELHRQFEEMYNEAKVDIDEIAERILILGTLPLGTLHAYLKTSTIKEVVQPLSPAAMVGELVKDKDVLTAKMRETIHLATEAGDEGTVDLLSTYLKNQEKRQWMLRAFLKEQEDRVKL
jgi:starvation-inducible DNA-binding protein